MKNIGLLACMFVLAAGSVFAQDYYMSKDFDVKLSKPFRVVDAQSKMYLNNSDHIVSLKNTKGNAFVIQSFDPNTLDEVSRGEAELDRKADFEMFIRTNKRFYVFYTLYDKPNVTEQLFAQEIDPKTSKFTGEPKMLLGVQGKIAGVFEGGWSFKVSDKFGFEHSKSHDKLLVRFRMKPEHRNDDISFDRIGLYVFDANLNQIWGDIREMKYTEAQMDIEDYTVDDQGSAYLLGKIFKDGNKDRKKRGDTELNYTYELMKLSGKNEIADFKELVLDDNRFVKAATIQEQDENKLIIAGYYNNDPKSTAIIGAFVFIVDKNTSEHRKNYYEIPLDVINAHESKRTVKKNTKKDDDEDEGVGLASLKLRDIFVDDAGDITLIGEQYWVKTRTYTSSNGQTRTTYTYFYADILVSKVTADGKLAWMTKIPKTQTGSRGKGGMSYSIIGTDKHLYVMYLDNQKNNDLPIDEQPKKHVDGQGGFLTSSKINYETGEVTKENLFDLRDVNGITAYQFATNRILNLSDDEIAVEVYKKQKEDVWIRVGLN